MKLMRSATPRLMPASILRTKLAELAKWTRVSLRQLRRPGARFEVAKQSSAQQRLFIFGCQRSGTTLLCEIFEKDMRVVVMRERSPLSGTPSGKLRMKPLDQVLQILDKTNASLVVVKPIVESQNAERIVAKVPQAHGLWLYRDFRDVANSHVNLFPHANEVDRILLNRTDDWRSEHVSPQTFDLLRHFQRQGINPYENSALFWYARNILFFENGLDRHPSLRLYPYEELVSRPEELMKELYGWVGVDYPGQDLAKNTHGRSVGIGNRNPIRDEISHRCRQLLDRLNDSYRTQQTAVSNRQFQKSKNGS